MAPPQKQSGITTQGVPALTVQAEMIRLHTLFIPLNSRMYNLISGGVLFNTALGEFHLVSNWQRSEGHFKGHVLARLWGQMTR